MLVRVFAIVAGLLVAPSASAQDYASAPQVSVERAGEGGAAHASMDVAAPPAAVWAVLSDCPHARRFMRDLLSCRVLERGQGYEIREHRIRGWALKPVMRNVLRIDMTPNRRLAFRRVAGDWARSEGAWTLTPLEGGRGTHVEYDIAAAMDGPVQAPRSALVEGVRNTLAALRAAAQAQTASS